MYINSVNSIWSADIFHIVLKLSFSQTEIFFKLQIPSFDLLKDAKTKCKSHHDDGKNKNVG